MTGSGGTGGTMTGSGSTGGTMTGSGSTGGTMTGTGTSGNTLIGVTFGEEVVSIIIKNISEDTQEMPQSQNTAPQGTK